MREVFPTTDESRRVIESMLSKDGINMSSPDLPEELQDLVDYLANRVELVGLGFLRKDCTGKKLVNCVTCENPYPIGLKPFTHGNCPRCYVELETKKCGVSVPIIQEETFHPRLQRMPEGGYRA